MSNLYVCPRCNYETTMKIHMKDHFYRRKKPCPDKNNLILTTEIKETVLNNHIYHRPQTSTPPTTTIINNYNTLNAMIVKLDAIDKLDKLLGYTGKNLIDFDDHVDEIFKSDVSKMQRDIPKITYKLDEQRICQLVDGLTRAKPKEFETINSFLDIKTKRINIYLNKEWDSYLMADGINRIMVSMHSTYFSQYELYLVRRIHNPKSSGYIQNPETRGQSDMELVGHEIKENNSFHISEECQRIYNEQKEKLTKSKITETKRLFVDIIKNNTTYNVGEINKEVINIMQADEKFKDLVIDKFSGSNQLSSDAQD